VKSVDKLYCSSDYDYSLPSFQAVGYLLHSGFAYNEEMALTYWLFVAGTLALTALIGYNTYLSAQLLRRWRPAQNLLLLPAENLLRLLLIGLCIGLGWLSGLEPGQLGWVWPAGPGPLFRGLVWGGVLALAFAASTFWIVRRTGQRFYSPVVVQAIVPRNRGELVLVCLAMAPVVLLEELLFRSLLLGGLAPVLPLPWLVIGWSLFFGLLHSPQGLWGMVGAGLGGMLLSWLFLREGTLVTPLVAHYVTNIVQLIQAMRLRGALEPDAPDWVESKL
jgi:membrane protease YdiL (CAAX protease family)